jgi:DNA-binding beta-propeller fold protein YncE
MRVFTPNTQQFSEQPNRSFRARVFGGFGEGGRSRFARWTACIVAVFAFASLPVPGDEPHLPQPYRQVEGWGKLPPGRIWGHVFGVGTDSHNNVWVLDRCGEASCVDSSNVAPIQEFDSAGNFIKSIGTGLFVFPHSLLVDKDDNIWVTDCGVKNGRGNQVFKLDPDGKVLLTLGKKGVLGGSPDNFVGPTDVAIAPNGDIFVADGHAALSLGGGEFYGHIEGDSSASRMRVLRFSKDGKFILSWGKEGTGPGEFNVPHGIAIDSTGRIFVADRGNNRIQIFDQQGKYLAEWKQFGKPCGLFIDAKDNIYVADSDSNEDLWDYKYSVDNPCADCLKRVRRPPDVGADNITFTEGIRIGSTKDGVVRAYIPPRMGPAGPIDLTERVSVDSQGNVYLADARTLHIRKYTLNSRQPM